MWSVQTFVGWSNRAEGGRINRPFCVQLEERYDDEGGEEEDTYEGLRWPGSCTILMSSSATGVVCFSLETYLFGQGIRNREESWMRPSRRAS